MSQTDLSVCNLAIGRVGGEPIEALSEDDSPLGAYCATFYEQKKALCLSKYRWVFATKVAQLSHISTPGLVRPLPNLFARPGDLGGAIYACRASADLREPPVRTINVGRHICSEAPELWAEYTAIKPEVEWPPAFVELVVLAFAADLARNRQNMSLGREMDVLAWGTPEQRAMGTPGGQFAIACAEDALMAPQRQLSNAGPVWDDGPLVAARMGCDPFSPFGGGVTVVITPPS